MIVSRTCTEIGEGSGEQLQGEGGKPLEEFRSVPAYVLLGDPGTGKTETFKMECEALGDEAYHRPISADEFLERVNDFPSEWRERTLFIDGLDEVRAGSQDVSAQFREIRKGLRSLGAPRFRLSCRHADWRGRLDENKLQTITEDSGLIILQLDPLTPGDIEEILKARSDIPNASVFIDSAHENRVGGFLENPQTLKMLADVVGTSDEWPASRKELFEKACDKMVREHNKEHQDAHDSNNPLSSEQLLNAAGRLCAVQLISGAYGYTRRGEPDAKYPALDQCDYDLAVLRSALATKLFKGVFNNRFVPIHRHIAEFLAGRYLSGIIDTHEGVSARRVIALITEKGMAVTEMRGLSGWLAAHNKDARAYLIEQDPVGVGLYGDISTFLPDEKRRLLDSLKGEKSRLDYPRLQQTVAFRALATPDMESALKDFLTDADRGEAHQLVANLVLRVLQDGKSLPGLSGILLEIIRDARNPWRPIVRKLALDAFIQNGPVTEDKTSKLKALLAYIRSGSVSDPDKELLGTLLIHLYPRHLSPLEVWDYLADGGHFPIGGRYHLFWQAYLIQKSSDKEIADLLDNLAERVSRLRSILHSRRLGWFHLRLLARGLQAYGSQINTERLYDWLDVGFTGPLGLSGFNRDTEASPQIRFWLTQHPKVQKAIIMEGFKRCTASDGNNDFDICVSRVEEHRYDADPPADYGLWCLEKAVALAESKPRIAEYLLAVAARAFERQRGNEGLSLDLLIERAGSVKVLEGKLNQILAPQPLRPTFFEYQKESKKYVEEQRSREEEWVAYVRSNETALRKNRAIPQLLYWIAREYFSNNGHPFLGFSTENGPKAVEQSLQGDERLTDAALQGMQGVLNRKDLPEIEEIFDLHDRGRMHYLAWPFLAGLAEVERTAPEGDASEWDEDRIRKAVAFYYCTPHADYRPQWYRQLLTECPDLVADIQVQSAISAFRSGADYIYELYELAHHPDHAQVARYASLPLLRAFPARCTLKQAQYLDYLLWAAIRYADRTLLQELIAKKRLLKSMNVAQRIRWLAAGVIIAPEAFGDALKDFVQGRKSRVLSLWQFIYSGDEAQFAFRNLDISASGFLIHLLGSHFAQYRPMGSRIITAEEEASGFVGSLIDRLAKFPDEEASNVLTNLLANPALLERWRDVLKQAQETQLTIRRDADYRHPNIKQVCETLDNRSPANPADLKALVMDRLYEIARQIRAGNTDDWRQYWNEDEGGPKHEELCRDALLSDLRLRLPQGVDAQREGSYANDKRADISVFYAGFNVPVEVKKNSHLKLWSALHDQLIAKYTIDPDTDGYGIYLVFWLGEEYTAKKCPSRDARPDNAAEMKQWLEDSLSPEQARKISVCVIDVSKPDGK